VRAALATAGDYSGAMPRGLFGAGDTARPVRYAQGALAAQAQVGARARSAALRIVALNAPGRVPDVRAVV
jgi:hypothetical protein